jgi:hypothetical protein
MSFSVKEGTFSFYVPDDEAADAAIGKELQQVKWNFERAPSRKRKKYRHTRP